MRVWRYYRQGFKNIEILRLIFLIFWTNTARNIVWTLNLVYLSHTSKILWNLSNMKNSIIFLRCWGMSFVLRIIELMINCQHRKIWRDKRNSGFLNRRDSINNYLKCWKWWPLTLMQKHRSPHLLPNWWMSIWQRIQQKNTIIEN